MLGDQRKREKAALPASGRSRVDFIGAAVPLHAQSEPSPAADADLSNVVPFIAPLARRRKSGGQREAPLLSIDAASRPAPLAQRRRERIALLLLCSVAAHAGIYALFNRDPQPLASIGLQSISVELVLGADTPAGLSNTPSESQVTVAAIPQEAKPQAAKPEAARKQPEPSPPEPEVKPRETQVAKAEVKPAEEFKARELKAQPAAEIEAAKPKPARREPAAAQSLPIEATLEPADAEITAETKPVERAQPRPEPKPAEKPLEVAAAVAPTEKSQPTAREMPAELPPEAKTSEKTSEKFLDKTSEKPVLAEPEKTDEIKETPKKPPQVKQARRDAKNKRDVAAPAPTPMVASSGIGRGRSDLDRNYQGMVHAHLARFHHVPIDMTQRRDSGEAVIRFSIDAQGRVGSVRLLRSSGNARIDAEAQATARRASPFPQPPDRRGQEFDAPLRYSVR